VSSRYWLPISLAICFITSLLLRIIPPFHQIFTPLGVKFALNDAYYHMRLVDNLAHNFPNFSYYDPYFVFPGTTVIGGAHFFDWLLATISWIAGLGSPTQATIDVVGVYMPPIMAALLVIPVYFIGKSVFNKWVGLIGAGLVAILPGEFLGRSILGAADHHVAEVLFSTTVLMFFILAIKSVYTRQTRIFTILAGVFLGIYLLTWAGGVLFVGIIGLFVVIQIIANHLRRDPSKRVAVITGTVFAITLLMNYSRTMPKEILLVLGLAIIVPVTLALLSWLMFRMKWRSAVFPAVIIVSGILFLVVANWLYPSFTGYLSMLLPSGSTATTTLELQPMLSPHGQFTLEVLWGNFTTVSVLAPVALAVLVGVTIKDKGNDEGRLLLAIWSVVMIALMLNQRRYAYYAVVNISLLSGYLGYLAIRYTTWTKVLSEKLGRKLNRKEKRRWERKQRMTKALSAFVLPGAVAVAFTLLIVPATMNVSIDTARQAAFVPPNAWQSAMLWLESNTPEPFQGKDKYREFTPLSKKNKPPVPDYAVSAWWDYGYWITRIGHRVPNANPAQNVDAVERIADLFLSEGDEYRGIVSALKSQYVVLDSGTALGKFYAVASWGDRDASEYFGYYRVPHDVDGYRTLLLFYPAYYRTLVSRLYNFNGEVVVPERTVVITYRGSDVLEAKEFRDYEKAREYVDRNPNTRIVSADPRISPVPLEKMDYELVYGSEEMVNGLAEVKIFEYVPEKGEK